MSKLTKYKVVNLPYPGRVGLFGIGQVELHNLTDKQADEIHATGVCKKYLVPVEQLPAPIDAEKPKQTRNQRKKQLS